MFPKYTQNRGPNSLDTVLEDEDVPPPPPPHPFIFIFPEYLFGGWPYYANYTLGTRSQGSTFWNNGYQRFSCGPDLYYENTNGNNDMRTRHYSGDDLDGHGLQGYTQCESASAENSLMNGLQGTPGGHEWTSFKALLFLLAFVLVFGGMAFFVLQLHWYFEAAATVDKVSNIHEGRAYCTCECEDLQELFTFRKFHQSRDQLNDMLQRKIARRD